MARRIVARFHPQAWVNDYAIAVDPQGETTWDITDHIVEMGREAALALKDDDFATDHLRRAGGAPDWVQDWRGPFWVEVEETISTYFGDE